MKISFVSNYGEEIKYKCTTEIPESAAIWEIMETITNMLLTMGCNWVNVYEAHILEIERMKRIMQHEKTKTIHKET